MFIIQGKLFSPHLLALKEIQVLCQIQSNRAFQRFTFVLRNFNDIFEGIFRKYFAQFCQFLLFFANLKAIFAIFVGYLSKTFKQRWLNFYLRLLSVYNPLIYYYCTNFLDAANIIGNVFCPRPKFSLSIAFFGMFLMSVCETEFIDWWFDFSRSLCKYYLGDWFGCGAFTWECLLFLFWEILSGNEYLFLFFCLSVKVLSNVI